MFARLALAALLLTGCSHSPVGVAVAGGHLAARATQRVTLTVPAARLAEARDAAQDAFKPFAEEWVTDMYGRKEHPRYRLEAVSPTDRAAFDVHVSRDGFKTTLAETTMYDGRALGADLAVPYFAEAGEVTYYVEVHATRVEVATGKREALPVRYVSNFGRNFQANLR